MKTGDSINGYKITSEVKVGGNCTWAFANYAGKEYFIKEFLSPVFPLPESPGSEKTKQQKRKRCEEFEKHQNKIIKKVSDCVAEGGNLIFTRDFFRQKSKYYKVTEKVDISSISIDKIAKLPFENKILILKTSTHCVRTLHNLDIIHGDLKPDNLLIKENGFKGKKNYIGKLIDFDDSYFSEQISSVRDNVSGDLAYYSPELQRYINEEPETNRTDIDLKSDIFALGIIFCQYLTGSFPKGVTKENTAATLVNSGDVITIKSDKDIPRNVCDLINYMLLYDKDKRPDIKQIFNKLKTYDHEPVPEPPRPVIKPKVKINMGKKKKSVPEPKPVEPAKPSVKIHMGKRHKK